LWRRGARLCVFNFYDVLWYENLPADVGCAALSQVRPAAHLHLCYAVRVLRHFRVGQRVRVTSVMIVRDDNSSTGT
jgi:hypothetical protein